MNEWILQLAQQFEKKPDDWLRYQNVQDYIQALLRKMNNVRIANQQYNVNSNVCHEKDQVVNSRLGTKTIIYNDLIFIVHGGAPGQHGTWLHPKLAVIFARWLSPDFAVWCDELITKLLNQHPGQQQQFPELSVIFEKLEQHQHKTDQRFEQVADMFNNLHTKLAQDNKHALGQIFNGINQLNKTLSQQQQADLLKPPVEVGIKQTLLDYQHSLEQMLQQMLHGQQDELIQNYLLAIKENLERIVQRVVTEPVPTITQPVTQPITPPIAAADLVTEITALKAQGWSWQRIAQELNARGTATVSGTGQWYGSSVKRYVESHIHH